MPKYPFTREGQAGLNEGEIHHVRIEDTGKQGDGIARVHGLVVFVPGAKPGDELDVKITKVGRNCAFAEKASAPSEGAPPA